MTHKSNSISSLVIASALIVLLSRSGWGACPTDNEYLVYNALLKQIAEKAASGSWSKGDPQLDDDHGDSQHEWAKSMWARSLSGGARGHLTVRLEVDLDSIDSERSKFLTKEMKDFPGSEIVDNFNSKEGEDCVLSAAHFDSTLGINVIARQELKGLFKSDGWAAFYKRFPESDGLVWLSRVGFDKSGEFALVCYQRQFGELGGSGTYYLLKKTSDGWKIVSSAISWIS